MLYIENDSAVPNQADMTISICFRSPFVEWARDLQCRRESELQERKQLMKRLATLGLLALLAPMTYAASTVPTAPELDGTGTLAAIGLLAGVVAVMAERRRGK